METHDFRRKRGDSVNKKFAIIALIAASLLLVPLGLVIGAMLMFGSAMSCQTGDRQVSGTAGRAALDLNLAAAIKENAQGDGRLAVSMLFGSYVESGWNPGAISQDGAFGAYQIQSPGVVHPNVTVEQALNPAFATNYMLPAYKGALRVVDQSLWSTNPEQAMMQVAYAAEKPRYIYSEPPPKSQGPAAVRRAYEASMKALGEMELSLTANVLSVTVPSVQADGTAVDACGQYGGISIASGATAQTVLEAAQSQLGVPYVFGGGNNNGPSGSSLAPGIGFDCASYVRYAFHKAGIDLPAGSRAQYYATLDQRVPAGQEQPGDLVFFGGYTGTANGPGHVGIVIDPARKLMLNEPRTGDVAKISSYDWGSDVMGFTRPYPSTN